MQNTLHLYDISRLLHIQKICFVSNKCGMAWGTKMMEHPSYDEIWDDKI